MNVQLIVCSDTEQRRRLTARADSTVIALPLATGAEALTVAQRIDVCSCRVAPPLSDMSVASFVARWRTAWPDRPIDEPAGDPDPSLRIGRWTLDTATGLAVCGERRVELTAIEVKLLVYLAAREGRLVSRAELMTEVWGYSPGASSRAVDHGLRRLRAKIDDVPDGPLFEHVRSGGLRLARPSGDTTGARLVGREPVLDAIQRGLVHGGRLIALVGPPGAGRSAVLRAWATAAGAPVTATLPTDGSPLAAVDDWSGGAGPLLAWLSADAARRVVVVATAPLRTRQGVVIQVPPLTDAEADSLWRRLGSPLGTDESKALLATCGGLPARIVRAAAVSRWVPWPVLLEHAARSFDRTTPSPSEGRLLEAVGAEFGLADLAPVGLDVLDQVDRMVERGILLRIADSVPDGEPRFRRV